MLQDLYESTLTLHFYIGLLGHRFKENNLDISSDRILKALMVGETTETRIFPFLKVKCANKGFDDLNLSEILHQKYVQSTIRYESPCISFSYDRSKI